MNPLSNSNLSSKWQINLKGKLEQTYSLNLPSKQKDSPSTPTEQFVSSNPTLEPQTLKEAPQKFAPTKEPSGEMAEMLANMQEAETRYQTHGSNTTALIQAEHRAIGSCIVQFEDNALQTPEHSQSLDGVLANLIAKADKETAGDHSVGDHHGHKTSSHKGHGHLGAHIGLEAGELKAQALQLKAQVLDVKVELQNSALDLKSNTIDLKSHAVDLKSHAVSAKSHAVTTKNEIAAEAAQQLHQSGSAGVDGAISQVQNAHGATQVHGAGELASHGMSTGMQIATGLIGGLSGVLGVFMLKHGWKDFKAGREHKDLEHTIEGANSMVVGTRSVAAGLTAAGHIAHGGVLGAIGSVAQVTLAPLGVIHGVVDAGIGVKDVAVGIKNKDVGKIFKGSMGTGLGTCLVVSALGGGLPALLGAGAFLVGKFGHDFYQYKQKSKELERELTANANPNPELTNQHH